MTQKLEEPDISIKDLKMLINNVIENYDENSIVDSPKIIENCFSILKFFEK